jgi:hypothetical protein
MTRADDPSATPVGGYAVPTPRHTDAVGGTLRRAYGPRSDLLSPALASLLNRLRLVP